MADRPLPSELVQRLKSNATILERFLPGLNNIDPRQDQNPVRTGPRDVLNWGGKVRQLRIHRNFPDLRTVVIKRIEEAQRNADWCIEGVNEIVDEHNEKPGSSNLPYHLRKPFAYPISDTLIAMAKSENPNLMEMVSGRGFRIYKGRFITRRGREFRRQLQREHGITREQLVQIAKSLMQHSPLSPDDVLVTGFKKGKLQLVALPDYNFWRHAFFEMARSSAKQSGPS